MWYVMSHNMHAWNPYSVQSFSFSVQYTPVSSTIFFWPSIALPPTRFNNKFYTSHSTGYRKSAARGRHTPPPSSPPTNRPTVRRSEGCIVENPCLPLATRSLWTDGWWRRNFNNHSYYVLHFLGYCHPPSATHHQLPSYRFQSVLTAAEAEESTDMQGRVWNT